MPDTDVRRLETAVLVLGNTVKALESFLASRSEAAMDDTHRLLVASAYMLQENDHEAAQWLKTIDKDKLGNRESAIYAFVNVEWLVRNGHSEEARKQLVLLSRTDLFPTQAFRLEALELQISAPAPLLLD
jgi:outer membrane PBP1 activator LpoA protein